MTARVLIDVFDRARARRRTPGSESDATLTMRALAATLRVPIAQQALPDFADADRRHAGGCRLEPVVAGLLRRWFGPAAPEARVIVDGLTELVAGRGGRGVPTAALDDVARSRVCDGKLKSVLAEDGDRRARGSFVNFLLATAGADAVQVFLRNYDPGRRDAAAIEAFGRPLAALEEAWLARIGQSPGTVSALGSVIRHLWPLLRPYWRRQLEAASYMILELAYTLAIPLSTKYLVDRVIPAGNTHGLVEVTFALLAVYVLDIGIAMRRAMVTILVQQAVTVSLQQRMLEHLQRLSHDFYARAKVGDLISRFTVDINDIERVLAAVGGVGVYMLLTALVSSVTLVVLSPLLGAIILVLIPAFLASYVVLRGRLRAASLERQKRTGEAAAFLQESILGQDVIKAFGLEARTIAGYRSRLISLRRGMLSLARLGVVFEASTLLAISFGQLLVLGVGGYLTVTHSLTVGTLVAFIALLPSVIGPISQLASLGQTIQGASGAFRRITELLQERVEINDAADARALSPLSASIRCQDVSFAYAPERPVLERVTLEIAAGTHVALVGPSGSGKSTLAHLLLRFWDPTGGTIEFDGVDIRDATLASLRGQLALVAQETFVFDSTIRENIALGQPGASDAQVQAAACAAELDEFVVSLPAGYDTLVGERGLRMSGGQRQRLGIARALLRNPQVLVLDEATSALDPQTEGQVLRTLDAVSRGRTRVTITHRLAVAASADVIYVLDRGRIVEHGTHRQLRDAGGVYDRLHRELRGVARAEAAG